MTSGAPGRSRGALVLAPERCTSCLACARECPNWCIDIEAHTETTPAAAPRRRERSRLVLDRFAVDFGRCMYCGVCVEVCPAEVLSWRAQPPGAATDRKGLHHERDRLSAASAHVPSAGAPGVPAGSGGGNTRSRRGR